MDSESNQEVKVFYQCKICKQYLLSRKTYVEHKSSAHLFPAAPKKTKVDVGSGWSVFKAGPISTHGHRMRKSPVKVAEYPKPIAINVADMETETEEYGMLSSPETSSEKSPGYRRPSDKSSSFPKITCVTGRGGVLGVVEIKTENDESDDEVQIIYPPRGTFPGISKIPVLLENIKVEPSKTSVAPIPKKRHTEKISEEKSTISSTPQPISPLKNKIDDSTVKSQIHRKIEDKSAKCSTGRLNVNKSLYAADTNLAQKAADASESNVVQDIVRQMNAPIPAAIPKQGDEKTGEAYGIIVGTWEFWPDEENCEELSPACSYVNALNSKAAQQKMLTQKSAEGDSSATLTSPNQTNHIALPSHITLLSDAEGKRVYQCNSCKIRLYNETQFSPHKNCNRELKPLPKKKRYCICRNTFEGIWKIGMIQCTECRKWYHGKCMGLSDEFLKKIEPHKAWLCFSCKESKLKSNKDWAFENGFVAPPPLSPVAPVTSS